MWYSVCDMGGSIDYGIGYGVWVDPLCGIEYGIWGMGSLAIGCTRLTHRQWMLLKLSLLCHLSQWWHGSAQSRESL